MEKIKIYFPDGHLEQSVWNALTEAGYRLQKSERGYLIRVDHPDIIFKQVRPQIMPFYVMRGKGDGGFTGEDIFENAKLAYKDLEEKVIPLERLKFRPTKLVVAVSEEIYPNVRSIEDFIAEVGDREVMFASEFPEIARKYAERVGLNAVVFDPIGKTEASLISPKPEADIILEVTESGTTLKENGARIIDVINREVHSLFIANRESMKDRRKRQIMENLITDIKEVLTSRDYVSLVFNVPNEEDIQPILKFLTEKGFDPTVSQLSQGGVAMHVILDRSQVKFLKPNLRDLGARRIATSPIITFGE